MQKAGLYGISDIFKRSNDIIFDRKKIRKWLTGVSVTNGIGRLPQSGRPKILIEAERESVVVNFSLNPFSKASETEAGYNVNYTNYRSAITLRYLFAYINFVMLTHHSQ